MLIQPESVVIVGDEKQKAIDLANQKLFIIQNEIAIAQKTSRQEKAESERLTKERMYQEELLESSMSAASESVNKLNALSEEVSQSERKLDAIKAEILAIELENKQKRDLLDKETKSLEVREARAQEENSRLIALSSEISKEKELVEKTKKILLDALISVGTIYGDIPTRPTI